MTSLEALEEAAEALHQYHPQQQGRPIGKGICTYRPCALLREVKARLQSLDVEARQKELESHRARLQQEF